MAFKINLISLLELLDGSPKIPPIHFKFATESREGAVTASFICYRVHPYPLSAYVLLSFLCGMFKILLALAGLGR